MLDRRKVLAVVGAAGLAAATGVAAAPDRVRRSGRVGGRQVRTIDVHAHCVIDVRDVLAGTPLQGKGVPSGPETYGLNAARLAAMDRQRIDVQVLSVNPYWYAADRPVAEKLIEFQNLGLKQLCEQEPGRFFPMAGVALQHPELAADQLKDAVRRLGMRAVAIGCSVEGEELSNRRFDPFWRVAEELGVVIFMHPQDSVVATGIGKRIQGSGFLGNVVGNPLETTLAISHLIFDGTLDRFPGLRLCAAHGGGYLPSYAGRSDHGCFVLPSACAAGPALKRKPSEYLKQLYVDSLLFTPEGIRHVAAEAGARQIMIGTDYPYPWVDAPLDPVMATPGLSNEDKVAILGGTACRLLGIPA